MGIRRQGDDGIRRTIDSTETAFKLIQTADGRLVPLTGADERTGPSDTQSDRALPLEAPLLLGASIILVLLVAIGLSIRKRLIFPDGPSIERARLRLLEVSPWRLLRGRRARLRVPRGSVSCR